VAAVRRVPADAGFTLVEMIVSITVISIVMAALAAFFVSSMRLTRMQGDRQTAIQLAADAMERAHKLEPAALPSGRDEVSVGTQWAHPVDGVDLSGMQQVSDPSAAIGAGASAPLRTTYEAVTLGAITYRRYWYLGTCWQPKDGGACSAAAGYAEMYRLVVAVTWTDNTCAEAGCRYVTSTLISAKFPDPLFNVNEG
jgi:prepilin-type N-terminal cleavage/methylation domain-containing protein